MSKCAVDYLKVICDPFDYRTKGESVCIPDILDLPSKKFNTFMKGTFQIGANGLAFIALAPLYYGNNNAWISLNAAGSSPTAFTVASSPGFAPVNNLQFPITDSALGKFRLVACGLRIRYAGTQLSMGGIVCPYTCGSADEVLTGLTLTQIAGRGDAKTYNLDRSWRGTTWRPLSPDYYQYTLTGSSAYSTAGLKMGIAITGTKDQTLEFEAAAYYEQIPTATLNVDNTTASHSDINGLSMVRNALGSFSSSEVGQGLWNGAKSFLKTQSKGLGPYGQASSLLLEYL